MNNRRVRRAVPTSIRLMALLMVVVVGLVSSCADDYVSSTSDSHVCVFDGSEKGGQKLKFQIAPGEEAKEVDDNDVAVKIPASNRFYMASQDDGTRDPLAPTFYTGFAQRGVEVAVQGQVRFRFNLKLACEWYSKSGRRNANESNDDPLGFNVRGAEAADAGWFHYLAENFGVTMQEVVSEVVGKYDWPAMVYTYPTNADEAGIVPDGTEAAETTNLALGRDLGQAFTDRLAANIGGNYFCGTDQPEKGEDCPPMRFQVIEVHTANPELEKSRSQLEARRDDLRNQELEGEITQRQSDAIIRAEAAKQKILEQQLITAEIQAKVDTAKCRALAEFGLDCEGKRPNVLIPGGTTGG